MRGPSRPSSGPPGSRAPPSTPPPREFVRGLFDWLEPNYESAVLLYSWGNDLRWKSELLRRLVPRAGERALDLACGTGLIHRRLVRALGRDAVVGLDLNRAMLLHARERRPDSRLVQADSVRLPFRDAAFDLVTAGYLFKYVPLDALGREIRRVLTPNGRFGGYDFSAPIRDRVVGRLYSGYLHRVLPELGRWPRPGADRWRDLFEFLSRWTTESRWETRVEEAFLRSGFETVERVPSLGGAITWVWGWARGAPSARVPAVA